ncbi:hypothetical protein KIL84_020522 [Mauremys mutica]|uniref:Uncharacterized protein n=1 Tax=Mauremys mutica TaxID=74926 RepID=A0A9D3XWY6_9SAUR|nr:hypothetical protein KIL84_020522 [Mauremys mutica]
MLQFYDFFPIFVKVARAEASPPSPIAGVPQSIEGSLDLCHLLGAGANQTGAAARQKYSHLFLEMQPDYAWGNRQIDRESLAHVSIWRTLDGGKGSPPWHIHPPKQLVEGVWGAGKC